MIRFNAYSSLVAAGLVALLSPGCEQSQSQRQNEPGNMPAWNDKETETPRVNATTLFAHASLLERQGDFQRASEQYRAALKAMPNFVAARNRLGITLNKLGKHAEASKEFRQVLARDGSLSFVQNNLGFSLYLEGKYEEAEVVLRRAIELNPGFARAHMNRGVVLAKLGRFDEALVEFKQAGGEADAHYNIAMIQTEAGRYADAALSLDAALRLNPKLEAARQQLREVSRLAAGDMGKAAAQPTDTPAPVLSPVTTASYETTAASPLPTESVSGLTTPRQSTEPTPPFDDQPRIEPQTPAPTSPEPTMTGDAVSPTGGHSTLNTDSQWTAQPPAERFQLAAAVETVAEVADERYATTIIGGTAQPSIGAPPPAIDPLAGLATCPTAGSQSDGMQFVCRALLHARDVLRQSAQPSPSTLALSAGR